MKLIQVFILFAIVQPGLLFPQFNTFRPFLIIIIVVAVVWLTGKRHSGQKERGETRRIKKLLLLLFFCESLASILNLGFRGSLGVVVDWLEIVLAFYFIYDTVKTEEDIRKVLLTCIIAMVVVICRATIRLYIEPYTMREGRLGSYGMYEGANDYGLLLTCFFPMVLKVTEWLRNTFYRFILFGFFAFGVFHLFLTGSRGSLLGSSAVIALSLYTRTSLSKRSRKIVAFSGIALLIVLGGSMLTGLRQNADFLGGDASSETRKDAWAAGGRMLLAHPLGTGFNQFRENVKEFGSGYGIKESVEAHNTYVKVAADAGIVGLFAYVGILYLTVKELMRLEFYYRLIQPHRKVVIIQGLLFVLVGFMINTSFSVKEYEWLLYITLACGTRLITLESEVLRQRWT